MGEIAASAPDEERSCYRCKSSIAGSHWFTLSADYRGDGDGRFKNTERYICADCLAGIGMLEFQEQTAEEVKEQPSLRNRLSLRYDSC